MTELIFFKDESWDDHTKEIFLHAQFSDQDELIRCRVPLEILRDIFGASCSEKTELHSTFKRHRVEIEKIMTELIKAKKYEVDGTIVVKKQDISFNN